MSDDDVQILPALGSAPVENDDWKAGKTQATIDFVAEATAFLKKNRDLPIKNACMRLATIVERLKGGQKEFPTPVDFTAFYKLLEEDYP